MTENKRFTIDRFDLLEGEPVNVEEVCNLLNKLHEENQVLKSTNMEMEDYLARIELENLKLKNRCKNIRIYVDDFLHDLNRGFLGISRDDLRVVMEKIRWYAEGEDK